MKSFPQWSVKTSVSLTALVGSLIVCAQLASIAIRGKTICLNQGCRVVETLTTVSPLYFNLLGLAYFQVVFWLFRRWDSRSPLAVDLPGIVLLAGISVEGVLLGYQIFVVRTLCSYCLLILAVVVLLNTFAGRRQLVTGAAIVIGITLIFSLLRFGSSITLSRIQGLDAGTYAVKTSSYSSTKMYILFSSNCPHCQNVIRAVDNCSIYSFHLNPIEQIESINVSNIKRTPSYSPEINSMLLLLLGIKQVPLMIVRNANGFTIIEGDKEIIHYIQQR
jgi:hypothetical protein